MNYLREINSFRLYLKTNPIPATAQALWYVLADYHNSCGWERWITIDNLRLQAELMISKPTLNQHRLTLMQTGLIEYKSQQKKKSSGKYKLLSFELGEVKSSKETGQKFLPDLQTGKEILPDTLPDTLPDRLPESLPDPLHLNKDKLNETKQKDKESNKESKGTSAFVHPSLSEVIKYCKERNNNVDPQQWHDYYTSNGWKVGKNPMKDWRAAVRTWEKKDGFKSKPVSPLPPQKSVADKYDPFYDMLMEEAKRGNTS